MRVSWRVSILTRPEGRVQRNASLHIVIVRKFQSSPVPKDGCNIPRVYGQPRFVAVSILTRPEGRVQLSASSARSTSSAEFQSSPVPKDGCNNHR